MFVLIKPCLLLAVLQLDIQVILYLLTKCWGKNPAIICHDIDMIISNPAQKELMQKSKNNPSLTRTQHSPGRRSVRHLVLIVAIIQNKYTFGTSIGDRRLSFIMICVWKSFRVIYMLTHWLLGNLNAILGTEFSKPLQRLIAEVSLVNLP